MSSQTLKIKQKNSNTRLSTIILYCFILWPFFWNMWRSLALPVSLFGTGAPVIFLVLIAFVSVLPGKIKIHKTMALWLVFYLVTILEIDKANVRIYTLDVGISFCSWLICSSAVRKEYKSRNLIRLLCNLGLMVAVSIILERLFQPFSGILRGLYSQEALSGLREDGFHGGMIPLSGSAGCYVVPGFAALVILNEDSRQREHFFFLKAAVFFFAFILLRKRGFILDIAIAFVLIKYYRIRSQGKLTIQYNRFMKKILIAIGVFASILAMYLFVPFINSAISSLLYKISMEDGDFSGRVQLYRRAFGLFKENKLMGIGWGRFRAESVGVYVSNSTKTYEVHNVYIQLLCENGILGLLAFLIPAIGCFKYTTKKYMSCLASDTEDKEAVITIKFSMFIQIFFLAYCISGNPLYDYNFSVTYFIGLLFMLWERGTKNEDRSIDFFQGK